MSQQIKDLVSSCSLCADYVAAQVKEPFLTPQLPSRPQSIVAQDLYSLAGKDFPITVDAYGGFWEVGQLSKTTAADKINKSKQHFARYGIPDRVYSDNGPQFNCTEYASFVDSSQFEHHTAPCITNNPTGWQRQPLNMQKPYRRCKKNWTRYVNELPTSYQCPSGRYRYPKGRYGQRNQNNTTTCTTPFGAQGPTRS